MVKQYFAAPASSAGVERVFSAAGKMHGDLRKSGKDTTLEASIFAAFNTDWCAAHPNHSSLNPSRALPPLPILTLASRRSLIAPLAAGRRIMC